MSLMGGEETHANYDAAMRLVELSANPKERKSKLEELKAAQVAVDKQQDTVDESLDELRTERAVLEKREIAATVKEKANAKLAEALSTTKKALDEETASRRHEGETERRRLTDAARAHDRREKGLKALAHEVETDTASAKKLMAKAQAQKKLYDDKLAALREIVCN